MNIARQIIFTVLLLAVVASFGASNTWSQPDPQYQQWLANAEALYEPGVDENYLLNQLEQDNFVKDLGRGGAGMPGMFFPNFDLLDINGVSHNLYESTKDQGKFTVMLTGSGFT